MAKEPKVIAVVGPTSSGKTSLSIEIARNFSGEVISADSRQVYRGMDIATGKVTLNEMRGVPHHLLDIADPMQTYTAADFTHDATKVISEICDRKNVPIITGGTFFYIELLRGNIQSSPVPPNTKIRLGLEKLTTSELQDALKIADPDRFETIDVNNRRRLIRSLEITSTLGTVPKPKPIESPYEWLLIGIDIPKEELHRNIHKRLSERMEAGMIAEAERLHNEGVTLERLTELGLEYRLLAKYLQRGLTEDELVRQIEIKNRQYAKKQMTWLKRDKSIEWYDPKNLTIILQRVEKFLA